MNILIVDDDIGIRKSIIFALNGDGYSFSEAGSIQDAEAQLNLSLSGQKEFDLLILDVHLSDGSGVDLFKKLKVKSNFEIPTLCISGAATAKEAAEAIKYGVFDYIEKPFSADRLKSTIFRLNQFLKIQEQAKSNFNLRKVDLIGESDFIKKLKYDLPSFSQKDFKVLITGETGTGKEVIANAISELSPRSSKPFVTFNAAAIPDSLFESEFFGFKKGSFTGALRDHTGKAGLAHNGTLFMDEIGDLSIQSQIKLLRFLETGEIQKLGGQSNEKVDVRIIAATSKNLELEIKENRFRADLFYRLNVIHIHIPPLRLRTKDIVPLLLYFMEQFRLKYELNVKQIDSEALDFILSYNWPGNVRELRNFAEKISIINHEIIRKIHISNMLSQINIDPQKNKFEVMTFKEFKKKSEAEYLQFILNKTNGNISEASRILELDRSSLHQKIKSFNFSI